MSISTDRLNMIRANVDLAITELAAASGLDFGLDPHSVAWTEGFIERQRVDGAGASDGLVSVLGSYLGEAVIAAVPGARWAEDADGTLGVQFANGDMVFPFAKVAKQLADGLAFGESILSFYNVAVNYVAANRLGAAGASEAQ